MSTFGDFTQGYRSLWLLAIVAALVFILLMRGVGAIERASLYLVPVLVLIVVGLTVYAQTLSVARQSRTPPRLAPTSSLWQSESWKVQPTSPSDRLVSA